MKGFDITLLFDGQAEEAFNFYKSVFGGEFINVNLYLIQKKIKYCTWLFQ
jgi:predicted 3-demethylubiquinone-9 3-methyltransferase (glyoxalase superfamily)